MLVMGRRCRASVVGAAVVLAGIAGCSEANEGAVEVQVVTGYTPAQDVGYEVRVESPTDTETAELGTGDQTVRANWALIDMDLQEGDDVTFTVLTASGAEIVSETCVVGDAAAIEYARVFVYYLEPRIDCADGFVT